MATISSHYFRECVRGAARKGVDTRTLLAAAEVDPRLLTDAHARGDVETMARLVREVWACLDDEFMGFTEHPAKVGLFGLMLRCAASGESLGQFLQSALRFYELTRTDVRISMSRRDGEVLLDFGLAKPDLDPNHYFIEFWMVVWHRLAGWITGGPLPLRLATFVFAEPVTYREEFKYLFPCRYEFDAEANSFSFDEAYLRLPVIRNRDEIKAMLRTAPLMFMTMPASDFGWVRRVRAALLPRPSQPVDFPSLEQIAEGLHLAPQTLRRKLRREGSSYRDIKENIRRDIAIQKVLKGSMRIEDIALSVGYVETRSFTRAFRHWTGESPLRYRQKFRETAGQIDGPGFAETGTDDST